ncbi:toprim domain-containing protein [Sphingobacterium multivorum]|uniref:toprim domain-containing protein n=1 Tax=Sphingobacterium multivorum TaxID=28454 RepID=UPI0028AF8293|nr:toprim domain-containing protein [Sphingobacterium multivorum]
MEFRKKGLSISEAKQIDMVPYLSLIGFEPEKIRANDFWYRSPLRIENTPSFKVNRKLNRWYDHGIGRGGNLIDFGILFFECTVAELLKKLDDGFSFQTPVVGLPKITGERENKISVTRDYPLSSTALLNYFKERRIPTDVADNYCMEVRYEMDGRKYFGIGFRNDLGGWEIRNPYFKGSSSPKAPTSFKNLSKEIMVFEGFMDFLSFLSLHKNIPFETYDYTVLNSISFFEKAREFLESHERINLYLDNDKAGQNCAAYALSLDSRYTDTSTLYKYHKDLNDFLVNFGRPPDLQ